jgi:hypothetical protein
MGIRSWLAGLNNQTRTTKLAVHLYALDSFKIDQAHVEWESVRPSDKAMSGFAQLFGDDRWKQCDRLYLALLYYCTALTSRAMSQGETQESYHYLLDSIVGRLVHSGISGYRDSEFLLVETPRGQLQRSYHSTLFRARNGRLMNYDEYPTGGPPAGEMFAAGAALQSAIQLCGEEESGFVASWIGGVYDFYSKESFLPGSSVSAVSYGFTDAIQFETRKRAAKPGVAVPDFG